jgi:hypothetical protein
MSNTLVSGLESVAQEFTSSRDFALKGIDLP